MTMDASIGENAEKVLAGLDALGIGYRLVTHPAVTSMEECERIAEGTGAHHFKNLFLQNKRGTEFYLVLIGRNKRFNTSSVSRQLGSTRLSFTTEEKLFSVLGLKKGAISAVGLLNDAAHRVHVAIDGDILKEERLLIHPGVNTASLVITTDDLKRLLSLLGYEPRVISVPELADRTDE